VDYCGINNITKKNRNAPLVIKDTLARINKVKIISIINVIAAFNIVCIKEGNKKKTVFSTCYRIFKYNVMLFRLYNALGTF
jgi:hypothetical protein